MPPLPFSHSVWPLILATSRAHTFNDGPWLMRRALSRFPYPARGLYVPGFETLWGRIGTHSLLDAFRLANLARRLNDSVALPGDVFECGTAGGGTALLMALFLRQQGSDKRVWIFDSFEGLPEPDRKIDRLYGRGAYAYSVEDVRSLLASQGVEDRCEIRKGWFSETLPQLPPEQRFCMGHIDADLYHSTRQCLAALYGRVPDGGALVVDDYYDGSGGAFRAVNEMARDLDETIYLGPTCQCSLIKQRRGNNLLALQVKDMGRAPLRVSIEHLPELTGYLEFLEDCCVRLGLFRMRLLAMLVPGLSPGRLRLLIESIHGYLQMCKGGARGRDVEWWLELDGRIEAPVGRCDTS